VMTEQKLYHWASLSEAAELLGIGRNLAYQLAQSVSDFGLSCRTTVGIL